MSSSRKIGALMILVIMILPLQLVMASEQIEDEAPPRYVPLSSRSINCNPPGSGQWDVNVVTKCVNEQLTVNGNITVTAKLELIDTTLTFDNDYEDGYDLKAMPGSELRINGSTINSTRSDRYFAILVDTGVTFSINNSVVDGAGWKDLERFSGASSGAELTEYNKYFWLLAAGTTNLGLTGDDGIEIRSTPLAFHNNTFTNYTHIRFFSDDNVVEDNTFKDIKHEGVAFMHDTVRHTIRYNDFSNATRINREIHGLRFYPNNQVVEIGHNTFDWIPFAISISNIPPWTSGYNFDIHHNDITRTITGFNGNFRKSRVHENDFHYNWKHISLEATRDLLVDNNTFVDVTFQKDLENVVTQQYYNEVESRGLLLNMAYWMWGFYCSKFHMNIGWWGRNITISDNYFSKGPPYTMALNTDQHSGMSDVKILNNTFEDIGTYIPNGYIIRKDWTGYNQIINHTPLSGSAIMLEGSDDVTIKGNIFMNVVNAITTSGPDALGNFGSFDIGDNLIRGTGTFPWTEQRYSGGWWSGNHNTSEDGLGIATSIHYINGGGPDWQPWHLTIYESDSLQRIHNNTIYDYGFPVVIDYRRDQARADEMGNKTALVEDNIILKYIDTQSRVDFPNRIDWGTNVEEKKYPIPFPNVIDKDGHHYEASGRYYIVPGGMRFPDHDALHLSEWDELTWTPVGRSGDLAVEYSTDSGVQWTPLPANGSLAQASTATGKIKFDIDLTTTYRLTRALEYDLNLTYVFNTPPTLQPLTDITAHKHELVELAAIASDADGDILSFSWTQVTGPNVTLNNALTNAANFTPVESGVYVFKVEVGDGVVTLNDTMSVSVENRAPTMTVDAPALALKGQEVVLNGTAHDEDGDELSFDWTQLEGGAVDLNWNDTSDPSFVPGEVGTYRFMVEVSDGEAMAEPAEVSVEVEGRPPVANLSVWPVEVTEGDNVTVSANASEDPDGRVDLFLFDLGDNTTVGWTNLSWFEHAYEASGEYTVSLTVKDDDGNVSATVTQDIMVLKRLYPPVASFTVKPETGPVGTRFMFTDRSTDVDGEIVIRYWEFGDGAHTTGNVVFHEYDVAGLYNVTLTVVDDQNFSGVYSVEVNVTPLPNNRPNIVSYTPQGDQPQMKSKSKLTLSVVVVDDDGDVISYIWLVDGMEVEGNASSLLFEPGRPGVHNITVKATDGLSEPVERTWNVLVKAKDIDTPEDQTFLWAAISAAIIGIIIGVVIVLLWLRKRGTPPVEQAPAVQQEPLDPPPQVQEGMEPPPAEEGQELI